MWGKGKKSVNKKDFEINVGDDIQPYLKKFEDLIDDCLKTIKPEYMEFLKSFGESDFPKLEETFMLRYVISEKGNKEKILESLKKAFKWRIESKDILSGLELSDDGFTFQYGLDGSEERNRYLDIRKHIVTGCFIDGGKFGAVVQVNRLSKTKQKTLLKKYKLKQLLEYVTMMEEGMFRAAVKATKSSGKFIQKITISDFKGFGFRNKEADMGFLKIMTEYKKYGPFIHPELESKKFAMFMPTQLSLMMGAIKAILGKGQDIVKVSSKTEPLVEAMKKFPPLATLRIDEFLPKFVGGKTQTPPFFGVE